MREKDERKKAGVTSTTPACHTQRNFLLLPLQPGGGGAEGECGGEAAGECGTRAAMRLECVCVRSS